MNEGPSGFIPPKHAPCAACGRPLDPKAALYSSQGELICDGCFGTQGVNDRVSRAARNIAFGTLVAALVSWFCNPFFIFSIIAIANAVGALRLLVRAEVKSSLGSAHSSMMIVSLLGLGIAAARLLLELGVVGLSMFLR
ncbi:MAG: hypothetical protein HS104_19990 [Polyangiaceae bacterium]|nr:hypothetical protein [Polyangiaceae bacterium]MBK8998578.1 hypothetical protein [Myxococcales bacterium]